MLALCGEGLLGACCLLPRTLNRPLDNRFGRVKKRNLPVLEFVMQTATRLPVRIKGATFCGVRCVLQSAAHKTRRTAALSYLLQVSMQTGASRRSQDPFDLANSFIRKASIHLSSRSTPDQNESSDSIAVSAWA